MQKDNNIILGVFNSIATLFAVEICTVEQNQIPLNSNKLNKCVSVKCSSDHRIKNYLNKILS